MLRAARGEPQQVEGLGARHRVRAVAEAEGVLQLLEAADRHLGAQELGAWPRAHLEEDVLGRRRHRQLRAAERATQTGPQACPSPRAPEANSVPQLDPSSRRTAEAATADAVAIKGRRT
jgi:hypothetical protein